MGKEWRLTNKSRFSRSIPYFLILLPGLLENAHMVAGWLHQMKNKTHQEKEKERKDFSFPSFSLQSGVENITTRLQEEELGDQLQIGWAIKV